MLLPSAVTVFYVGFLVTAIYGKVGIHGRRAVDIYDPIILCDSIRTFYSYKDITCPYESLPTVTNGFFNNSSCSGNIYGDICNVTCIQNYYTTNSSTVCQLGPVPGEISGIWSGDTFICKKSECLAVDLPGVLHGSFQWCRDAMPSYDIGTVCNITCDYGYFAADLTEIQCELNSFNIGSWSSVVRVICEAIKCEDTTLPSVVNGYFDGSRCGDLVGDSCRMICTDGHYPETESVTECELLEGETFAVWSDDIPYCCKEPKCLEVDLPAILNGSYSMCPNAISSYSVGTICTPSCDNGYFSTNLEQVECQLNSDNTTSWSTSDNMTCEAITCEIGSLPSVVNGYFDGPSCNYHVGDSCHMTCNNGYYPVTDSQTQCQVVEGETFGVWSDEISYSCQEITCDIASLPSVVNGYFDGSSCNDHVGSSCYMTCNSGYYPVTDAETQCHVVDGENFGVWSEEISYSCQEPKCLEVDLPNILNGSYSMCPDTTSSYNVGTICTPSCDYGYFSTNLEQVECQLNSDNTTSWSTSITMTCEAITCDDSTLPSVTNGHFDESRCTDRVGDSCHMTCDAGHYPVTDSETQCEQVVGENFGAWSADISYACEEPKCLFLDLPGVLQGSYASCTNSISSYSVGTICNPSCNSGYYSTGLVQVECQLNADYTASWSTSVSITCEAITCDDATLPSVTNGHFDGSSCTDRVGDSCHMTCDAGHYPVTDSETQCEQVVGENFGSWSADISYACEEPKCLFLDLPGILQGSYASCTNSISSYSVGTICNPSCNSGYYSTGLVQVECQLNADNTASWSTSASMTCEVITCDASTLPSVTNGYFDGSSCTDHVGDTCHMTCDAGHYPVTDSETQCEQVEGENFGSWSAVISYMCEEPKCLFLDLPGVLQGSYASCPNSISSYIVGTICNPACNSGYYSTSLTQVECQLNADNTASWSTSASMTCEVAYLDCKEIYDAGNSANGIYTIVPSSGSSFQVYCKMDNGGGWTVFQRRTDATVSFVQDWETYKNGFGDLNGNFWLGNDKLYHFTNQKTYELRIDVQKSNGGAEHATYPEFQIESESMKYRLNKLGDHSSGNAGEYFYRNKGKYFSTYDMDNDQCAMFNCAEKHKSGWWHSNEDCDYCWGDYCSCFQQGSCCYTCSYENLNGEYNGASGQNMYTSDTDHCNLMYVEMKLRPS